MKSNNPSNTFFSSLKGEGGEHCLELPPLSSYEETSCCETSFSCLDVQFNSVIDETVRLKKARKAERDKINSKIENTAALVIKKGVAVGFKRKEASLNGFKGKTSLPEFIQPLLLQCKRLPYRDDFLDQSDGLCRGKSQKRSKVILGYMLSAFVVNCNISNGFIVAATRKGGINLTHDELRMEVALRHGVFIPESTWYFYINRLVRCGYIKSHAVSIYEDGHVASFHAEASHKSLSSELMSMLGAERLSVRTGAAKHEAKLKLSGQTFKQKPRYPSSRYRIDGSLRLNMTSVEPTQELLDFISVYLQREAYCAPPPG